MSTIGLIRAQWDNELAQGGDPPTTDAWFARSTVALYTVAEDGTYTHLSQFSAMVYGVYSLYYERPSYDFVAPLSGNRVLLARDPWYMYTTDAEERAAVIVDLSTGATSYSAYAIKCIRPLLRSDDGRIFFAGEATLLADNMMAQGLWEIKPDATLEMVMEGYVEVEGSVVFEGGNVWSRNPTVGGDTFISQSLATGTSSTSNTAPREIPLLSSYYAGAVSRHIGPYSSTPTAADIVGLDSEFSVGPSPDFNSYYRLTEIQTFPTLEASLIPVGGNTPVSLAPLYAAVEALYPTTIVGYNPSLEVDFLPLMLAPGGAPAFVPKWKSLSGVIEI